MAVILFRCNTYHISANQMINLIEKYLKGKCTPEERAKVEQWYEEYAAEDRDFYLDDDDRFKDAAERSLSVIREKMASSTLATKEESVVARENGRNIIFWRLAAAVAFVCLSTCLYLYTRPVTDLQPLSKVQDPPLDDVPPGGNNAVLTLANGKRISLNQAQVGLLAEEGNTAVSKKGNGELTYHTGESLEKNIEPQFNTLTTPEGGQYHVVLADGTKVWLNALSSLRFPTSFSGKTRNVELIGEAYFEIAKNRAMPFNVKMPNGAEVRVTGTHFNAMAYEDENNISAILVEGAIQMANQSNLAILKPGQQAVLHKQTGMIEVSTADKEAAMAWKNGYFLFNGENIRSIMRKLTRWYGVEVLYEGPMGDKDFSGMVSRYKNVSEVLKMLELTGIIRFKIVGRRIYVMS